MSYWAAFARELGHDPADAQPRPRSRFEPEPGEVPEGITLDEQDGETQPSPSKPTTVRGPASPLAEEDRQDVAEPRIPRVDRASPIADVIDQHMTAAGQEAVVDALRASEPPTPARPLADQHQPALRPDLPQPEHTPEAAIRQVIEQKIVMPQDDASPAAAFPDAIPTDDGQPPAAATITALPQPPAPVQAEPIAIPPRETEAPMAEADQDAAAEPALKIEIGQIFIRIGADSAVSQDSRPLRPAKGAPVTSLGDFLAAGGRGR